MKKSFLTVFIFAASVGGFSRILLAQNFVEPIVTLYATDSHASEDGSDTGTFTVRRAGATDFPLAVFYQLSGSASNGVDYEHLGSSVQIPAGALEASFIVKPIDDSLVEDDESVVAQITGSPLDCATCGYTIGVPGDAMVVIAVVQQPMVNIYAIDDTGSEIPVVPPWLGLVQRSDPAFFTVTRTGPTNFPLTVFYNVGGTASNGVDYFYGSGDSDRLPGHVTIPAGASSVNIDVWVIDDFLVEGTETIELTLQPPVCIQIFPPPPDCYLVGPSSHAMASILDNDLTPAPVVTIVATDPDASESGPNMGRFTVSRTGDTSNLLPVFYTVGGTAQMAVDYHTDSNFEPFFNAFGLTNVVIPAGAASTDITVTPIDDSLAEGSETVVLQLQPQPWAPYLVGVPGHAVVTIADNDPDGTNAPVLQFLEPTNNAVFSTLDEIPIVLRAFAPDDVFPTADVLANGARIATASYCCWLCPCFAPMPGQELILRIPVPRGDGMPWTRTWQGWTNVHAGSYRLTARATGENGTVVESAPVNITVLDLTLRISVRADGAVMLVIPGGSLVAGGYDAEASQDLRTWTRLGPFLPGNVAAFYYDDPPASARARRFYRSVRVP